MKFYLPYKRDGVFLKYILALVFIISHLMCIAQTQEDTIHNEQALKEVIITRQNMKRMDNYVLIYPDNKQKKHSVNAIELLSNCFIPGINVDTQNGSIEALGAKSSIYMNGQPCETKDLLMLRPKDIEKIEYYDVPSGKYSNDRTAINFVVKQYRYGGYILAKAQQMIGYTHGDYDLSSTINHGKNTFSAFTGINYSKISDSESLSEEKFQFNTSLTRNQYNHSEKKGNDKYLQLRYQNRGKQNYIVTKLSLFCNNTPYTRIFGLSKIDTEDENEHFSEITQKNISPKFDVNGEYNWGQQSINYGAHFCFNRNNYSRFYRETSYINNIDEKEDAYSFSATCIYSTRIFKGAFTAELYHFHNIWNSIYSTNTDLHQHLWKGESLAFISYNRGITKKLNITSRLGIDWLQYSLHNSYRLSQVTPRINMKLQYKIKNGNIILSGNYVNSNYGTDIINNAEVEVDRYLSIKGNPNLKKSFDLVTYLYYMQQFNDKFTLSAISQYNLSHNYVTADYTFNQERIIRSFRNDGNTHLFSEILGLSYRFSSNASIGGDLRYAHSYLNGKTKIHVNNLTGNINAAFFLHEFSLQPSLNFAQQTLDFARLTIYKVPINYSLRCSYSHKNLFVSATISSPFTKRKIKTEIQTIPYSQFCEIYNHEQSKYCNITLAYTFDFGKKTKKINEELNNDTNSSLLKVNML